MRGEPKGVGDVLQGSGGCSTYFRVGDVGDNPPHGAGNWVVSTQGSYIDH